MLHIRRSKAEPQAKLNAHPTSCSYFANYNGQKGYYARANTPFEDEFSQVARSQGWVQGSQQFKRERTIAAAAELDHSYFSPSSRDASRATGPLKREEFDDDIVVLGIEEPPELPSRDTRPIAVGPHAASMSPSPASPTIKREPSIVVTTWTEQYASDLYNVTPRPKREALPSNLDIAQDTRYTAPLPPFPTIPTGDASNDDEQDEEDTRDEASEEEDTSNAEHLEDEGENSHEISDGNEVGDEDTAGDDTSVEEDGVDTEHAGYNPSDAANHIRRTEQRRQSVWRYPNGAAERLPPVLAPTFTAAPRISSVRSAANVPQPKAKRQPREKYADFVARRERQLRTDPTQVVTPVPLPTPPTPSPTAQQADSSYSHPASSDETPAASPHVALLPCSLPISEPDTNLSQAEVDLQGYQSLCREIGLDVPVTAMECKRALKNTYVNIIDLIDARRTGAQVRVWQSLADFARYTLQEGKRFDKEAAKGTRMKSLLQTLTGRKFHRRTQVEKRRNSKRTEAAAALEDESLTSIKPADALQAYVNAPAPSEKPQTAGPEQGPVCRSYAKYLQQRARWEDINFLPPGTLDEMEARESPPRQAFPFKSQSASAGSKRKAEEFGHEIVEKLAKTRRESTQAKLNHIKDIMSERREHLMSEERKAEQLKKKIARSNTARHPLRQRHATPRSRLAASCGSNSPKGCQRTLHPFR